MPSEQPIPTSGPEQDRVEALIAETARRLTDAKTARDTLADEKSWEMATIYCTSYAAIEAGLTAKEGKRPSPQQVNMRVREVEGYKGPGGSWLSDAKRTKETFPEVFRVNPKKLPYDHYRRIAISSLSLEKKQELLKWAEAGEINQAALRERISQEVAGVSADFDLKVTNFWKFHKRYEISPFDGGINIDLVANLLHYYTTPGASILDPMAGGRTTRRALEHFAYFREANPAMPNSGPRSLVEADISPIHPNVLQADVRKLHRCMAERSFDFVLLDPPYWQIAKGKYDHFGSTVEEWSENIRLALSALTRLLKPDGRIAVVVDDYLRSGERWPLALYVAEAAKKAGLAACESIYTMTSNALVSMGPAEMARAKKARMLVNGCKIIQLFQLMRSKDDPS